MCLPQVVSREEWLTARKALLDTEKMATRARDALNQARRRLPMVLVDAPYVFEGPDGPARLVDLFEGRRQLIVRHFMFDPTWETGCARCSAAADEISDALLEHLRARDTTLVQVSRAPHDRLERHRARHRWTIPWYSSHGTDFNADFGATVDDPPRERPGLSCFLRDGGRVFHTYSTYDRGLEAVDGLYAYLDLTALGRQEDWEEPRGRAA